MRSLFITGTDTGVGKTLVAASLLVAARARGIHAAPMKPVQTGCIARGRQLVAPDLDFCLSAADLNPAPQERHSMCPYRFIFASSPHLAAARTGAHIQKETIRTHFRRMLKKYDVIFVEGAGGILAPINGKNTMLDVMKTLRLPVLLVARAGLGTINHTLLSLAELRRAKLDILGLVVVQSTPGRQGLIEKDNLVMIEKLGGAPILASLPFQKHLEPAAFAPLLPKVFQALEK